jgi:hypothetical protein
MPCILCGKGQVKAIATVASDNFRFLPVPEVLNMNVPVDGFGREEINHYSCQYTCNQDKQ